MIRSDELTLLVSRYDTYPKREAPHSTTRGADFSSIGRPALVRAGREIHDRRGFAGEDPLYTYLVRRAKYYLRRASLFEVGTGRLRIVR